MTIRVLHVIDSLARGGAERSLIDLLQPLAALDVSVDIAVLKDADGPYAEEARRSGAAVRRVGPGALRSVRELRQLARRYDLVHTSLWSADQLARLAVLGRPTPVVTSLVSDPYGVERLAGSGVAEWKVRTIQVVDLLLGHRTTVFHAVSEAARQAGIASLRLRPERIVVVPRGRPDLSLGHDRASVRLRIRADLGLGEDELVVVAVGSQKPAKGHEVLVEAVAACRCQPTLLLIGRSGPSTPAVQAAVRRHAVEGRVRLLGERDDVAEVLAAADVFCLPSRWEGMPGVLIEAMSASIPAVATSIGPSLEVAGPTGARFVPPGDVASLAAALDDLFEHPDEQARLGAAGRDRYLEHFRIDVVAQRLAALYRVALGSTLADVGAAP